MKLSNFEKGFSLLELMVVMSLSAIVTSIGLWSMQELNNPLENSSFQLAGFFRQIRAHAIAETRAYKITPLSESRIVTHFGSSCDDPAMSEDLKNTLDLERGTALSNLDWEFCFNSRGIADQNLTLTIEDDEENSRNIEVYLGGGVRIDA